MRIVLDTNCLLQAVPPLSRCHIVLSALQQGRYELCCSTDILLEYEELLSQFYPPHVTENTMGFIVIRLIR
jgi:predicted nucleic acid-binding protein